MNIIHQGKYNFIILICEFLWAILAIFQKRDSVKSLCNATYVDCILYLIAVSDTYQADADMGGRQKCEKDWLFRIRQARKTYIEGCTIHGVARLYTGQKLERIFWGISVLVTFSFAVYMLHNSFSRYRRREHYTKVDLLHERRIKLPTISLCTREYLQMCSVYPVLGDSMCRKKYKDQFNVTKCTVGDLTAMSYSCDSNEFWIKHAGCVSINYNGTLQQTAPGFDFGLNFAVTFTTSSDIQLRMHDSSEPMDGEGYGDYRIIGSSYVEMHVSMKHIQRLPYPFKSDCTDGRDLPNYFNTGKYSVTSCRRVCRVLKLLETCGIVFPRAFHGIPIEIVARYRVTRANATDTERKLAHHKWKKCWISTLPKSFQRSGECHCPLPCSETRYSYVPIKTWELAGKNKTLIMNVHYETMKYTTWKEVPAFGLKRVMSEFGGLVGLLVGASLFSVLEVMAFFWLTILHFIYKRFISQ